MDGIRSCDLNPLSLSRIHKSVLPNTLHGCKLWKYYPSANILETERAHRCGVKYRQKFPIAANNYAALKSIGNVPIITDYRRLQFPGQLLKLRCHYLAKPIFTNRFVHSVEVIHISINLLVFTLS